MQADTSASFLVHLISSISMLVAYDFLFVRLALMTADYLGTAALIDGV